MQIKQHPNTIKAGWTYEFYHGHFGWLRIETVWPTKYEAKVHAADSAYPTRIIPADYE